MKIYTCDVIWELIRKHNYIHLSGRTQPTNVHMRSCQKSCLQPGQNSVIYLNYLKNLSYFLCSIAGSPVWFFSSESEKQCLYFFTFIELSQTDFINLIPRFCRLDMINYKRNIIPISWLEYFCYEYWNAQAFELII